MKGLEISKAYFEEFGKAAFLEKFPEVYNKLAFGVCGGGSECFGYDDDISVDHDFEPGFCIFIPGEDVIDRKTAFELDRVYAKLPQEFMGLKRSLLNPVGGKRRGVLRSAEYWMAHIGLEGAPNSPEEWFSIPDFALAEAVNGLIFEDNYGEFSAVRNALTNMPEDVRLKKLAGHLLLMAQSGQYNYERCIKHGETGAAQLAAFEFVQNAMSAIFLLNHSVKPFYKWSFRALRELPLLGSSAAGLEYLISSANAFGLDEEKTAVIEETAGMIITELQNQGLTDAICLDLEKHAYSVNDYVKDACIRTANVLSAV